MREVIDGCKVCGKRMLTDGSPLVRRTCDACKARQQREQRRRLAAKRKAERHEFKAELETPRCQQCGKLIEGVVRLTVPYSRWRTRGRARLAEPQWARKYCDSTCRQAAFRARNV